MGRSLRGGLDAGRLLPVDVRGANRDREPGVPALDSTRPKYRYDDPDAQIDGVTRVMLQTLASGKLRLQWKAEAVGLAAALSNGAMQLSVRIGDDSFNGAVQCTVRSTRAATDHLDAHSFRQRDT